MEAEQQQQQQQQLLQTKEREFTATRVQKWGCYVFHNIVFHIRLQVALPNFIHVAKENQKLYSPFKKYPSEFLYAI